MSPRALAISQANARIIRRAARLMERIAAIRDRRLTEPERARLMRCAAELRALPGLPPAA